MRDENLHAEVCARIAGWLDALDGWTVRGTTESPITGTDGNTEFLIAADKRP